MAALKDSSTLLSAAVRETLDELKLGGIDKAATRLAITYAEAIDANPKSVSYIGPRLLDALEALGATPRSRSKPTHNPVAGHGKLDRFINAAG